MVRRSQRLLGFMGGVVVNDEVKLTFAVIGERRVDTFQKAKNSW